MSESSHSPRDRTFHGFNACRALFEARPDAIRRVLLSESVAPRFGDLMRAMARMRRPYRVVDAAELDKVAGSRHHEGVCIIAEALSPPSPADLLEGLGDRPARYLFLDGVGNPHNVGAILRSAAHFGQSAVAGFPEELPAVAGAVARIAEGAAEHVPVLSWPDPGRALDRLAEQGFSSVATVVRGAPSLFETELPRRVVFLIGAERDGLSEAARDAADLGVTIPGTGTVESLNVAAACAVLLAEHARQHPS